MANILRCKKCGDIITSKHTYDMVWCKCGAIAIDGGDDYCKITGKPEDVEVFVPIELLTEKEKELKRIKKNWELSKGQQRRLYDSLKLRCKDALKQIDQDKIELLEKMKENISKVPITDYDFNGNFEKMYKQDAIRQIDNQIKQLKEME